MSDKFLPPRTLKLQIDVAVSSCGCSVVGCSRVTLPGEALVMREIPDSRCSEPLCAVHAAEAIEDARLKVRLWLHACEQKREGNHVVVRESETLQTTGL